MYGKLHFGYITINVHVIPNTPLCFRSLSDESKLMFKSMLALYTTVPSVLDHSNELDTIVLRTLEVSVRRVIVAALDKGTMYIIDIYKIFNECTFAPTLPIFKDRQVLEKHSKTFTYI